MPRRPKPKHRSGFVSIFGLPNAGKSTLLNALVGTKLAIVASKPQTTRTLVQGVATVPMAQVVFLDTPGIHRSERLIDRRMMDEVQSALEERDLLLYVVDVHKRLSDRDDEAIALLKRTGTPAIAVLNKIDVRRDKGLLLPLIEELQKRHSFEEYVPVSALRGDGVDDLLDVIVRRLPPGPPLFPEDYLTDQPERFLAAELVREKALELTRQEVPHSVAVLVEEWKEEGRLVRIAATIYVERDGQKAIMIGTQGQMLKQIGTEARTEMEQLLDRRVFLELYVKVRENWRENPHFLNELDWRRTMTPRLSATSAVEDGPALVDERDED